MTTKKISSDINWSDIEVPIPTNLFERFTQQSIHTPIQLFGIDQTLWSQCRTFALHRAKQGFVDPISILYTSFKHYYPFNVTLNIFTRWLLLDPDNQTEFSLNSLRYPIFETTTELVKYCQINQPIHFVDSTTNIDQIWFLLPISFLISSNTSILTPDHIVLDNNTTRLSVNYKKNSYQRLHCLVAITPSGKYSNQLLISKPGRYIKIDFPSNQFTRIVESSGDILYEHLQQWLEDFLAGSYSNKNSALLLDPRLTLLMPDFELNCTKSNIQILTMDLHSYISNILHPVISLFGKKWSEGHRIDRLMVKSTGYGQRIIFTLWFTLRTLKQNDALIQLFNQTILWKTNDQEYIQSLQAATKQLLPKKKKKKLLIKTNNPITDSKSKLPSSTMMIDPPMDSTPEQILSYILHRQMSISRASKYLGGMKLDYFKYCLSYKMDSSLMTGSCLVQLNAFMQSKLTVEWLRRLRSLYFWPCAKQIFLREIYHLTGIITRKRSMNICGDNNNGSIRNCDLQSPGIFWRAFEEIHQIQLDNESIIDEKEWNEDFQQYLYEKKLQQEKTQLWTMDMFEFPLTKKSTILQLPEWNDLRPMNSTPKVTVIYAFSTDGQSTEPYFIFPKSFNLQSNDDEHEAYNDLGHLTPSIFLSWIEKNFVQKGHPPMVLIFCSRLPVLSSTVLASLEQYQIYPFGYPSTRTLPFRYLFERRVRNNRSTNLMSELWKKKLLDQQRSHVLKGSNCTVENIKYYFEQIWPQLITEKRDDDEENKTFPDKCQQAFQQANIHLIIREKSSTVIDESVQQLEQLLTMINQMKEQIHSTQILKIKSNEFIEEMDFSCSTSDELMSNSSSQEKRSSDENDHPRSTKRLRSTHFSWIPPSKSDINHLHIQSSSLFQFLLSLLHTIITSSEFHLTNEHYHWLHQTINHYHSNFNVDKLNLLIDTACMVVKNDLVR